MASLLTLEQLAPSVVFLPAFESNVDLCESSPAETWKSNVEDIMAFLEACGALRVVFFSSEYVFDGSDGPYTESDTPRPLSVYGKQKLAIERFIAEHRPNDLIVRVTTVFGRELRRKNFGYRVIETLAAGRRLAVPVDQVSTPTHADQIAECVIRAADRGVTGVIHVAGTERISRHEFASRIARRSGLDERLIESVTTDRLSQRARRPLDAGLVSGRLDLRAEGMTDVDTAVDRFLRDVAEVTASDSASSPPVE